MTQREQKERKNRKKIKKDISGFHLHKHSVLWFWFLDFGFWILEFLGPSLTG
jgi:hypothetical protein